MAAVTSSAWGKPGAWALDSEQNESELTQQSKQDSSSKTPVSDFPSLSVAATTKTKKKKPQTISLSEFTTFGAAKAAARENQPKGLTQDEILALPTGPRERSAEELDRSKLGGGFRSYGGDRGDRESRRGSRDSEREFVPSRADENDNWGAGKKTGFGGGERRERGGFFGDSGSRADEVENWGSKKSFVVGEGRKYDRRGSFGLESSGGADSESWGRRNSNSFDSLSERRGESESWGRKREDLSENGGGGGSARPRLNLQPRTKPIEEIVVKKEVEDVVVKSEAVEVVNVVRAKGSNPFGAARPREEVLKEKGQDWKEIEEKFESVKVSERGAWGKSEVSERGAWGKSGSGRGERFRSGGGGGGERAWRKPESVGGGSRANSDAGSENGHAEKTENGHAADTDNGHAENTENGHAENTENGHAEDGETQQLE